jgi:hypothetical protein
VRQRTDATAVVGYLDFRAPSGAVHRQGNAMSSRSVLSLSALVLLCACQRQEPPPPTVILAPAGEPGAPGPAGATGETGKDGATAVVVVTPPASAASV